jgi:hypothetical protein
MYDVRWRDGLPGCQRTMAVGLANNRASTMTANGPCGTDTKWSAGRVCSLIVTREDRKWPFSFRFIHVIDVA